MKFPVCLFLCCGFFLSAQEPDAFWMTARSAKGRIECMAKDAVQMQQLSFWSERSLKQLEADWRTVVPFQQGSPLKIIVDPRAEKVFLRQTWEQGALKQTLFLTSSSMREHPAEIAETFTGAMAYRAGLAAMPDDRKNRNWQVPDWLIDGSSHALLAGVSRSLFESLVRDYRTSSPPYPEQAVLSGSSGEKESQRNAALLCRWLFANGQNGVWAVISREDFRQSEIWFQLRPSIGGVRELHQHWDVWWAEERNRLIAEYVLEEAADERLAREKIFIPGFYGLFVEEENRYLPVGFEGLEVYLDDPRFGPAMHEWILRLQRLRFRQSPEFNEQVEKLQEAGRLAIRAANAKGRKRGKFWEEAQRVYLGQ